VPNADCFLNSCFWSFPKEYQISKANFGIKLKLFSKGNYLLDWKGAKEYFTNGQSMFNVRGKINA